MSTFTELAAAARDRAKLADVLSGLWYVLPADDNERIAKQVMLVAESKPAEVKTLITKLETTCKTVIEDFLYDHDTDSTEDADAPSEESFREAARTLLQSTDGYNLVNGPAVSREDALANYDAFVEDNSIAMYRCTKHKRVIYTSEQLVTFVSDVIPTISNAAEYGPLKQRLLQFACSLTWPDPEYYFCKMLIKKHFNALFTYLDVLMRHYHNPHTKQIRARLECIANGL